MANATREPLLQTVADYRAEVDEEMLALYGIDWTDACGDSEPLERAMDDGQDALDFVLEWGARYELTNVQGWC